MIDPMMQHLLDVYTEKKNESMTGLELLRKELKTRGATTAQATSRVVAMVLDVLAESRESYTNMQKIEEDIERLQSQKKRLLKEVSELTEKRGIGYAQLKSDERMLQVRIDDAEENFRQMKQYIEQFNASLESMETEESRDRLRTAQVFVNSVEVKTVYDNTAYINWFGAILAGDKVGGIEAFKKINPELVTRHFQTKTKAGRIY